MSITEIYANDHRDPENDVEHLVAIKAAYDALTEALTAAVDDNRANPEMRVAAEVMRDYCDDGFDDSVSDLHEQATAHYASDRTPRMPGFPFVVAGVLKIAAGHCTRWADLNQAAE